MPRSKTKSLRPEQPVKWRKTSEIKKMDLTGDEKFRMVVREYLAKTTSRRAAKCSKCWLLRTGPHVRCICSKLKPLPFDLPVRFLVLIHYLEWFNAGDDSKILLNAAPGITEFFVFGREGDDERLQAEIEREDCLQLMLFPSETAITVDDFRPKLAELERGGGGGGDGRKGDTKNQKKKDVQKKGVEHETSEKSKKYINILVLDGTWRHVRAMKRHFERNIEINVKVPQIKLLPLSLEYWNKRGNISVYKRTQSQEDRICTIEAIALLLREFGEEQSLCDDLISYVEINNYAVTPPAHRKGLVKPKCFQEEEEQGGEEEGGEEGDEGDEGDEDDEGDEGEEEEEEKVKPQQKQKNKQQQKQQPQPQQKQRHHQQQKQKHQHQQQDPVKRKDKSNTMLIAFIILFLAVVVGLGFVDKSY